MTTYRPRTLIAIAIAALVGATAPASAELILSQMVVELTLSSRTADVLVFNDADEKAYVLIEPAEVLSAGTPGEKRISNPDPRSSGLLLSSTRLILEPRQKRLLRLAATSIPDEKERIYRVVVKPVVGDVDAKESGLKLLVGYEMLVMVRPARAGPISIDARRTGSDITLTNLGAASIELMDGQRCLNAKLKCTPLPAKRLYAGASWTQPVPSSEEVEYRVLSNGRVETLKF